MVALISKSSLPVKPRSARRKPRYSPVGMRSWVFKSLRVVVSSRAARSGLRRRLGSRSGRAEPGAGEPVRQPGPAALGRARCRGRGA